MSKKPVEPIQAYMIGGQLYYRPVRCFTQVTTTLAIRLPEQTPIPYPKDKKP